MIQELGIPEQLFTIGETMQEPQANPQDVRRWIENTLWMDERNYQRISDVVLPEARSAIVDALEHRASDILLESLQHGQGHIMLGEEGHVSLRRPDGVIFIDDALDSKLDAETTYQQYYERIQHFKQTYVSSPNGDIDLDAKPVPKPQTPPQPIKLKIVASEKDFDMRVVDARSGALIDNVISVDLHIKFQGDMPRAEALLRVRMPELDIVASGSLTEQDVLDDV